LSEKPEIGFVMRIFEARDPILKCRLFMETIEPGFQVGPARLQPQLMLERCRRAGAAGNGDRNSMDIHHIRYFLAFCETLNFTAAAERCNVAQPALSRAIQQLEEEVGGLLIRRERNRNSLTDLGLLMKPGFENILAELGQVKKQARQFLAVEQANLTLGIMCSVGPTRFAGMLVHFSRSNPGIHLKLREGDPDVLLERLRKGDIDLAIMSTPNGYPDDFSAELLYRERFVVAFPAGHRLAGMNAVPIGAIDGENYLRRLNCEHYQQLSELVEARGARSPVVFASEREDWIQNLVAGGFGICFIPEFSALVPGVQTRPLMDPEYWRDICLVTHGETKASPAAALFLKSLRIYPFPVSRFEDRATAI
jgi:LysR family hydrogen peroxide-inducible transcriptional activator